VGTNRKSKGCDRGRVRRVLACLAPLAIGACAAPRPPVTAVSIPEAPRRPDGVVVEPAPALPVATEHATARGVVALREPLGDEAVAQVVRAFFRAFEREDLDALRNLVTEDAMPMAALRGSRSSLLELWGQRMKTLDYGRLAGSEVARVDAMERWSYAALEGSATAPTLERPAEMRPGDLLVRVPIATPRVGSEQLFGDVVTLLLRRDGRGYKIAGFAEENGP
jgi:hypothetical protein